MFQGIFKKVLIGGVIAVSLLALAEVVKKVKSHFAAKKEAVAVEVQYEEKAEGLKVSGSDVASEPVAVRTVVVKKAAIYARGEDHFHSPIWPTPENPNPAEDRLAMVQVTTESVSWQVPPKAGNVTVENGIPQHEKKTFKSHSPEFFQLKDSREGEDPIGEAVLRFMANRIFNEFGMAGFIRYPSAVQELVQKATRGFVPGTEEFQNAFGPQLTGVIPRGVLVPKRKPLMSPAHEEALIRRYGWHKNAPLDLVFYEGWGPYQDQMERIIYSEDMIVSAHPVRLPRDWEDRIRGLLQILSDHIDGYQSDADNDDAITLLTTIMAVRNWAWGWGGMVGYEKALALYKYSIFCFRRILYTTWSAGSDPEEAADAFEEFLELISIPNPPRGDWMKHTPMKRIERV